MIQSNYQNDQLRGPSQGCSASRVARPVAVHPPTAILGIVQLGEDGGFAQKNEENMGETSKTWKTTMGRSFLCGKNLVFKQQTQEF